MTTTIKVSDLKKIIAEIINENIYDLPDQEDPSENPYGGWLDPNAKFHPIAYQEHGIYATHILSKLGIQRNLKESAYEEMFKLKFVRITFGGQALYFQYGNKPFAQYPSSKQMAEIKNLAIERGCTSLYDDVLDKFVDGGLLQESKEFKYIATEFDKMGYGGWMVEPNGTFHDVRQTDRSQQGHWNWSKNYIQTKLHKHLGEHDNPVEILMKLGWVKLMFNYYNDGELHFEYLKDSQISSSLLRKLKNHAIELHASALIDGNANKPLELNEARSLFNPDGNLRWWMDTNGTLNDVSKEGHRDWGYEYLSDKLGEKHKIIQMANTDYEVVYDVLFNEGWIRLVFIVEDKMLAYEYHDKKPNPKQIDIIKQLAKKLNASTLYNEKTGKMERFNGFKQQMEEDMSYEELLKLTTPERKERASNVNVRSLPVTVENNNEQWNFRYKSSPQTTVTDQPFKGSISFLKGKVGQNNNAMKMKCKVDCECPDFKYRFAYNDAAKNASQVGPDSLNKALNRRPKPAYDYGEGLCKHLTALGRFLKTKIQATKKSNLFEALDDVANQGPFNVTYYD